VIVPEWQQSVITVRLTPVRSESKVDRNQSSRSGFFQSRSDGHRISSRLSASSPSLSGTLEPCPEKCTSTTSPLRAPRIRDLIAVSMAFFVAAKSVKTLISAALNPYLLVSSVLMFLTSFTQPRRSAPGMR
jgi:hypothetical protein